MGRLLKGPGKIFRPVEQVHSYTLVRFKMDALKEGPLSYLPLATYTVHNNPNHS
jgi:hypothetical protein